VVRAFAMLLEMTFILVRWALRPLALMSMAVKRSIT
jgi:hypothetical protein